MWADPDCDIWSPLPGDAGESRESQSSLYLRPGARVSRSRPHSCTGSRSQAVRGGDQSSLKQSPGDSQTQRKTCDGVFFPPGVSERKQQNFGSKWLTEERALERRLVKLGLPGEVWALVARAALTVGAADTGREEGRSSPARRGASDRAQRGFAPD